MSMGLLTPRSRVRMRPLFAGKPIIGIAGGIGSGKTFVARLFADEGCLVIHSDEQVHQAYQQPEVRDTLRKWWGDQVFDPNGNLSRRAIAARVFSEPAERKRLESYIHPIVNSMRDKMMHERAADPTVRAFVWDVPLLFEAGLNKKCDHIVFVDAPHALRLDRVRATRAWDAVELDRRENLQTPLDTKRKMAHYVVINDGDDAFVREQVRNVLSRIFAGPGQAPQ